MMTFNIDGVIGRIDGMLARMAIMQPVMAEIGAKQASRVMLHIMQDKQDPDGHPWAAWMPATRGDRSRKGNVGQGLLWDEGSLLNSISVHATNDSVVIGTDKKYGEYLQDGTGHMAPRPYLGWGIKDSALAEHRVIRYLEGINA